MPGKPDLVPLAARATESSDLPGYLQRLFNGVVFLGAFRGTVLLAMFTSLGSLALTWVFLRAQGYAEMGEAFYISLLVPLPLVLPTGWVIVSLIVALERTRRSALAMAQTDSLTGLSNRRQFLQAAQREMDLAQRHRQPLALLMMDIDHFKRVNDQHGHDAGDQVLMAVSQRCTHVLRSTDLLARWGGEEFVVLMPNTPHDHAHQLAERLRESVEALTYASAPLKALKVTVSIGGAGFTPGQMHSLQALMQIADNALFDAKRAGRNQVWPTRSAFGNVIQFHTLEKRTAS